ncbi:eukaryotic translation initiation factor 2D-like isoform X2 [Palaemon carinicauda]|uniref:eukaryotic translation initiation factor 2D-like isoform X2 n=1 Tax=Palaemon carinicauda TaxID=392227 RepID=UPI0035B5F685
MSLFCGRIVPLDLMFIKPFKVKSQTQLKGSDRKKLRAELAQVFPLLTSEDLTKLIPNKEDVTLIRMHCYKGENVHVYQVQKDPAFFCLEREKMIYPTVYTLWKYPDLMHTFTTHTPVIDVLLGGADLMLPGIITRGEMSPRSYGKFEKGFPVAVNTTENKAPVAVGCTAHSSMDMFMAACQGKGVNILHVFKDTLWAMGSKSLPPSLGIPKIMIDKKIIKEERIDGIKTLTKELEDSEEVAEESVKGVVEDVENLDIDEVATNKSEVAPEDDAAQEEIPQASGPEVMDKLLLHCFLKAWKTSAKKVEIPILTSNFYRLHMVPACPDGTSLDIKKSSYKKLSKFLNAMAKNNIISVKEFPKGIENITAVNWNHEDIKNFVVDQGETTVKPVTKNENAFVPPIIEELYQVSGDTLPFYRANGLSKGDVLSTADVRRVVTDYIKRNKLQKEGDKNVTLNQLLHEVVVNKKEGFKEVLRWDEIFSRMLGKMSPAVRITREGAVPIIRKGKLEPIEIVVVKRTGNKKVTLVYNANMYGIDENEFAHQVQVGVAASTSVGPAENKPQGMTQVLIQGNQVAFIAKLLLG